MKKDDGQGEWLGKRDIAKVVDIFLKDPLGCDLPTPLAITCLLANALPDASPPLQSMSLDQPAETSSSSSQPLPPLAPSGSRSGMRSWLSSPPSEEASLSEPPVLSPTPPSPSSSSASSSSGALTTDASYDLFDLCSPMSCSDMSDDGSGNLIDVPLSVAKEQECMLMSDEQTSIQAPVASNVASNVEVSSDVKCAPEVFNTTCLPDTCFVKACEVNSDVPNVVTLMHEYMDSDDIIANQIIDDFKMKWW